jgi:hypothetical protein
VEFVRGDISATVLLPAGKDRLKAPACLLHQLVGTPHQRVTPLDERLRVLLKGCTPRTLVEIRRLSD